jgi:hypothetical protein
MRVTELTFWQGLHPACAKLTIPVPLGGLGVLGLLGWRRKRKNTAAIAAA